jgi:hypothetical protein
MVPEKFIREIIPNIIHPRDGRRVEIYNPVLKDRRAPLNMTKLLGSILSKGTFASSGAPISVTTGGFGVLEQRDGSNIIVAGRPNVSGLLGGNFYHAVLQSSFEMNVFHYPHIAVYRGIKFKRAIWLQGPEQGYLEAALIKVSSEPLL